MKQNMKLEENNYFKKNKVKIKKIVKEYETASNKEVWEGVRDNFTFWFLGATLVVFIATRTDIAVLMGYLIYYFFMGKIVNRPKYVTDLGKLIVFPIPSALGAFAGYKLSYVLLNLIQ
jgi:cbb3-type cytochrome oxidase subunit 1